MGESESEIECFLEEELLELCLLVLEVVELELFLEPELDSD